MNAPQGEHQSQSGSTAAALILEGISKKIDKTVVLRDLTLTLPCTDTVLLLGANGAGKSTLLRICSGLMRPSSGTIKVSTAGAARALLSAEVGYLGHQSMFYSSLSVRENLELTAVLWRLSPELIDQGIERWELEKHVNKRPEELSKGLLARASLCRTFMTNPRFLFLDEPTSALDQRSCEILLAELKRLRAFHCGQMVQVIATHDLTRIQSIAARVVILSAGSIIHDSVNTTSPNAVESAVAVYLEHNR